jgi:predicted TIM-barrel fold metal-dependent hydrolase
MPGHMPDRPPVVDADGHVLERQVDIAKYLPPPWNERRGGLFPGDQPWDTTLFGKLVFGRDMGIAYESGMSPEQQVDVWHRIMDEHGFDQAVCFPTGSGAVPGIRERDLQIVVARACNDHFAQEYNARSDRLRCVGVLPLRYPEEAAAELRRAVTELGFVGFELLTTGLPTALGDARYDPVYAEAERLGAALCVHGTRHWSHEVGAERLSTFAEVHTYAFPAALQLQFTSMVYQGVPVRFPKLRLAFLEIGVTWLPYYLDRMDEHWEKRAEVEMPLLRQKPSDVVRQASMYFSVEAGETLLPQAIDYVGDEHFVYASDIPHWDNEFPESLEHLWARPDLSRDTKQKILAENARTLFGLGERRPTVGSRG